MSLSFYSLQPCGRGHDLPQPVEWNLATGGLQSVKRANEWKENGQQKTTERVTCRQISVLTTVTSACNSLGVKESGIKSKILSNPVKSNQQNQTCTMDRQDIFVQDLWS